MKQLSRGRLFHSHHEHESGHEANKPLLHLPVGRWPQAVGVFLDLPSGAGGDMIVAALCDLGVPWSVVERAIASMGLRGVDIALRETHVGAIAALRFCVHVDEAQQTERSYAEVKQLLTSASLNERTKATSLSVFERLARAEAKVHRMSLDDVHFHEVGAVDSLCDVVGACAALDYLSAQLSCSPLPLGRGFIDCRHGRLPLPAPATIECLVGLQTYPVDLEVELVTPTAAAVLGALSQACVVWPRGTIRASGWGAGTLLLPDRPNVARAVLFEPEPHVSIAAG